MMEFEKNDPIQKGDVFRSTERSGHPFKYILILDERMCYTIDYYGEHRTQRYDWDLILNKDNFVKVC